MVRFVWWVEAGHCPNRMNLEMPALPPLADLVARPAATGGIAPPEERCATDLTDLVAETTDLGQFKLSLRERH